MNPNSDDVPSVNGTARTTAIGENDRQIYRPDDTGNQINSKIQSESDNPDIAGNQGHGQVG